MLLKSVLVLSSFSILINASTINQDTKPHSKRLRKGNLGKVLLGSAITAGGIYAGYKASKNWENEQDGSIVNRKPFLELENQPINKPVSWIYSVMVKSALPRTNLE